jgi:hypothetical protein
VGYGTQALCAGLTNSSAHNGCSIHSIKLVVAQGLAAVCISIETFAEFCDFEAMSCFGKEARLEAAI